MMALEQKVSDLLHMLEEQSDPRTMAWFFVPSPIPLFMVTALYLAFVYFGPRWMATRKTFNLKKVLVIYNFCLVFLSAWMVKEFAATSIFQPGFNWTCQLIDYSDNPVAIRLANVIWWYYFSKIIEYLDTVFFILRKKNNQISFLHVYHHSTMPLLWYIGIRYLAGGSSYFCAMVNSFIHVLMYGYYFLSAFGPRMQPYLWWKRYITTLQLVQFNLVILHTAMAYYTNCGFPRAYMVALICYCISHVVLFSNFFYRNYIAKAKVGANGIKSMEDKVIVDSPTNNNTWKSTRALSNGITRKRILKKE